MAQKSLKKESLMAAVYLGMKAVRSEVDAKTDYDEWLIELDKSNNFSLAHFINDYCQNHQLNTIQKNLLRTSLRNSLFINKKAVSNTPEIEQVSNGTLTEYTQPIIKEKKQTQSVESKSIVFVALSECLIKKALKSHVDYNEFIKALVYYFKVSNIQAENQAEFLNWCLDIENNTLQLTLELSEMSEIVHNIYNTLCDVIGPVEADTILGSAVEELKSSDCNYSFSPENFL